MFVCPECGAAQAQTGYCPADGTPLAAIGDDALLGSQIGPYRVARLLGIGGMGRVYKGVHPQIGSRVAIKVLSRECSDRRDLVERFFAEAKAVNVIRHENIVNVLDLATLPDGRPYIIMEYLDGAPLASVIEAGAPLPIGGIARLASEVLDALGAAHAKGIIHRDLKPDNIFVTPSGRAKVLDFGIAKLQPELGGSATHTGSLLGTPQYMSPEQAAGKSVDARADLYAMGVILFECATLQKPFVADSLFALLRAHIEAQPPQPRALRTDLPPALEHVIMTALAKHPDQRFASAQAMNLALQQATQDLGAEQWTPITPGPRTTASGWSPTPPATWRTGGGSTTSVASGQQQHATVPPRTRNTGLWIAIAAILLAGGGIAAAVVAGKSSSPPNEAAKEPIAQTTPPPTPALMTTPTPTTPAPAPTTPTPTPTPTQTPPAPTPPPTTPAFNPGLLERHPVAPPSFDPRHVDVDAFVAFAIAEATREVPDAKMTRIDADSVFPDGHADLTLPSFASPTGSIDVRFISPSHMTRDPSLPRNVTVKTNRVCEFRVMLDGTDGGEIYATGGDCNEAPIPKPRCSATAIWKKALAIKRDLKNTVAELTYTQNIVSHQIVWMFDVRNGTDTLYSEQFPDNC